MISYDMPVSPRFTNQFRVPVDISAYYIKEGFDPVLAQYSQQLFGYLMICIGSIIESEQHQLFGLRKLHRPQYRTR